MIFTPESYRIDDKPGVPFIDRDEIMEFLAEAKANNSTIDAIIQKSLNKQRLTLKEIACLVNADNNPWRNNADY